MAWSMRQQQDDEESCRRMLSGLRRWWEVLFLTGDVAQSDRLVCARVIHVAPAGMHRSCVCTWRMDDTDDWGTTVPHGWMTVYSRGGSTGSSGMGVYLGTGCTF